MSEVVDIKLNGDKDLDIALVDKADLDIALPDEQDIGISLADSNEMIVQLDSQAQQLEVELDSYRSGRLQEIVHIDTSAHWNAQLDFIGEKGHIYVYTDYLNVNGENIPAIKVSDGKAYLIDTPFASGNNDLLYDHIRNSDIHITAEERAYWNNKVTCFISHGDPCNLVFTTESEERYSNG